MKTDAQRIKVAERKLLAALRGWTGVVEARTLEELVAETAILMAHYSKCDLAKLEGMSAALDGKAESDCPYPDDGGRSYDLPWRVGYRRQAKQLDYRRLLLRVRERLERINTLDNSCASSDGGTDDCDLMRGMAYLALMDIDATLANWGEKGESDGQEA